MDAKKQDHPAIQPMIAGSRWSKTTIFARRGLSALADRGMRALS
jgi:hypothetical protein